MKVNNQPLDKIPFIYFDKRHRLLGKHLPQYFTISLKPEGFYIHDTGNPNDNHVSQASRNMRDLVEEMYPGFDRVYFKQVDDDTYISIGSTVLSAIIDKSALPIVYDGKWRSPDQIQRDLRTYRDRYNNTSSNKTTRDANKDKFNEIRDACIQQGRVDIAVKFPKL